MEKLGVVEGRAILNMRGLLKAVNRDRLLQDFGDILAPSLDFAPLAGLSKGAHLGLATRDFLRRRAAAIVIRCVENPMSVSRLLSVYARKINRGSKKPRVKKGSGALMRRIGQMLESAGLLTRCKGLRVSTIRAKELLKKLLKEGPNFEENSR